MWTDRSVPSAPGVTTVAQNVLAFIDLMDLCQQGQWFLTTC
jgi:hypothetical protein